MPVADDGTPLRQWQDLVSANVPYEEILFENLTRTLGIDDTLSEAEQATQVMQRKPGLMEAVASLHGATTAREWNAAMPAYYHVMPTSRIALLPPCPTDSATQPSQPTVLAPLDVPDDTPGRDPGAIRQVNKGDTPSGQKRHMLSQLGQLAKNSGDQSGGVFSKASDLQAALGIMPDLKAHEEKELADKRKQFRDTDEDESYMQEEEEELPKLVGLGKIKTGSFDATINGYKMLFPNITQDFLGDVARTFAPDQGLTFLWAHTCSTRLNDHAVEVAKKLIDQDAVPGGLVAQLRASARDYFRQSGQQRPSALTEIELLELREKLELIDQIRGKKVIPNALGALVRLRPGATVPNAMYILSATTGEADWLASNNILSTGALTGTFCEGTEPEPPVFRNGDGFEAELGNVKICDTFSEGSKCAYFLQAGRFGPQPVLTSRRQPLAGFCINTTEVTGFIEGGNSKKHSVDRILQTNCPQFVFSSITTGLLEAVVRAFWKDGRPVSIIVSNLPIEGVERMTRVWQAMEDKKREDDRKADKKPPPGGGKEEEKDGNKEPQTPDLPGADELAEDYLRDITEDGWGDPLDLARCASICFEKAKKTTTRLDYIKWSERGQAFATACDGVIYWDPGDNSHLRAVFEEGGTTAHFDSPQLSKAYTDWNQEAADVPDIQRAPDVCAWRDAFYERHGYWDVVGKANCFRTIINDEEATVDMASRIIASSGEVTPLQYCRSAITRQFRGCCDGVCYCDEPAPSAEDLSRSTGGKDLNIWHKEKCTAAWRFGTKRWMTMAMWKRPIAPRGGWQELVQTPAAASVDSLREIVEEINLQAPAWSDWDKPMGNIQLGGMPINCTLKMARYATLGCGLGRWKQACNGAPQMKCAFRIWLSSLSTQVREELERFDLHKMTLRMWLDWDSSCSTLIRRCCMVGRLKGDAWLQLRKVGAVSARHAIRADFEQEMVDRTVKPVTNWVPFGRFRQRYTHWCGVIGEHAARMVSKRGDHCDLREHWDMRAVRAPSGTSSNSRLLNHQGRGSDRGTPSDRPSKKAALSAVPWSWLVDAMTKLEIQLGRLSTKIEPKNRARTLGATGDLITTISDHALRGCEGSGNYGGMAASQRPDVVGRWIESAAVSYGWMWSADLDNQNWQHELWELQAMWNGLADGYKAVGDAAALSRANSAQFIANSFGRTVALWEGNINRLFSAMWSGHRGTTWNNTQDHEIDRLIALEQVRQLGMRCVHNHVCESGDDESLRTDTWEEGAAYIQMQRLCGVRMNAKKQLSGRHHGEYLQRCVSEDAPPMQAAASVIVTLCTGNWYRPSGTWMNSALDTCCSNWLEAGKRGVPRSVAARMCGLTLDQLLIDRWHGNKPLAWRRFARSNQAGAVLFEDCEGYGADTPPDLVVRAKPRPNWTSQGINDYLKTREAQWLRGLLDKEWMEKQWTDSLKFDAHASCEMGYHREETSKKVCERWPKGNDFKEIPLGLSPFRPAPGMQQTAQAWYTAKTSRRAQTEEDNLAAIGLGRREVGLLGGYDKVMADLPTEKWSRVKPILTPNEVDSHFAVDNAVTAALSMYTAVHPPFGQERPTPDKQRTIVVVAATHGSGISRLARRFQQRGAMRFDRLAAGWCGKQAYNRNYEGDSPTSESTRLCAERVAIRLRDGEKPNLRMLLCHEHPDIIVEQLKKCGFRSHWYLYYPEPGEAMERVAARNVEYTVLRYMQSTWQALFRLAGSVDELRNEEQVVQLVTAAA